MSVGTRFAPAPGRPSSGRPSAARRVLIAAILAAAVALAGSARADESTAPPTAVAGNLNIIIQVLWQVQEGCTRYCWGTTQTQIAQQNATSVQVAVATSTAPDGSALAGNTTTVIQVVIQTQLGCVEYCYDTSQLQAAEQHVAVTQVADAIAAAVAGAANAAPVDQLVLQFQQGCVLECYGATSTQSVVQTSTIDQSASGAASGAAGTAPTLDDLLATLAKITANATVSVVQQLDRAPCLEHCNGGVELQVAIQDDATTQRTIDVVAAQATVQIPVDEGAATATDAVPVAPEEVAQPRILRSAPQMSRHPRTAYRACAWAPIRNSRISGTRSGAGRKVARKARAQHRRDRLCFVITDVHR
jgi:hypothetical protein